MALQRTTPGSHAQPEVGVIESAGQQLAKGKDPYHAVTNSHGKVVYHAPETSTVDAFNPYLPIMDAFGIPSAAKKHDIVLTDARIFFSLATLALTAVALWLCPADGRRKMRTLQVIAILPTAALPLATGGDDMPVVAFLLLAMVLAQRRQAFASGVVLGIVSAMKFTAWPLAGLALFAARNRRGARRPGTMFFGMLVVAGPVVIPFALRGPWAFFDNVVLFPLGLSGVNSPAASPLPGHLLVSAFPFLHRALPVTVGLLGGAVLAWYLYRRPPRTVSQVCIVGGVVMAVATLLAPATRIGYLLYPINFFVWAYLFADSAQKPANSGTRPIPASRQLTYGESVPTDGARSVGVGHLEEPDGERGVAAGWGVWSEGGGRDHGTHLPVEAVRAGLLAQDLDCSRIVIGRPGLEDLPALALHVEPVEGIERTLRRVRLQPDLRVELVGGRAVVLV